MRSGKTAYADDNTFHSGNPTGQRPREFPLSHRTPFVAHLHPWEAKTKAEKKQRRRRNPSPNRNPGASARVSFQLRPSRAPTRPLRRATRRRKALPPGRAFLAIEGTESGSRIAEFEPHAA